MANVSRLEVVQSCLDLFEDPHYLEIGVCEAKTFAPLRAGRKVAVDPAFREGALDLIAAQPNAEAHELTSDAYFGGPGRGRRFDVIYLDGLHTFEQTLRDLLNAVVVLNDKGIVVVDDVYPDSYHASLRDRRQSTKLRQALGLGGGAWMGDVYRLTFFVDSFLQQFSYRMVSDNHGQLVVWRAPRPHVTDRSAEWVARAPFEAVLLDPDSQRRLTLADIVREAARDLGLAGP